jgi:hypothetical protein
MRHLCVLWPPPGYPRALLVSSWLGIRLLAAVAHVKHSLYHTHRILTVPSVD